MAVEELREPSFNHVADNAIASATMREPLETMVTSLDSQCQFHCVCHVPQHAYTYGMRGYIIELIQRRANVTYTRTELAVILLTAFHWVSGLHTGYSV